MSDKTRKPERPKKLDDGLDQDLARIREDWKQLDPVEPPELVDRAVLNTARRDLEPARKTRPLRWLGGLATATVVVLALTVMLDQSPPGVDTTSKPQLEESLRKLPPPTATPAVPAETAELEDAPPARISQDALPPASPPAMTREVRRQEKLGASDAERKTLPGAEEWIEEMLALKRAGMTEQLNAEMAAFRTIYPEFPLPAELTEEQP
jgi:hypothetical protein